MTTPWQQGEWELQGGARDKSRCRQEGSSGGSGMGVFVWRAQSSNGTWGWQRGGCAPRRSKTGGLKKKPRLLRHTEEWLCKQGVMANRRVELRFFAPPPQLPTISPPKTPGTQTACQ